MYEAADLIARMVGDRSARRSAHGERSLSAEISAVLRQAGKDIWIIAVGGWFSNKKSRTEGGSQLLLPLLPLPYTTSMAMIFTAPTATVVVDIHEPRKHNAHDYSC